MDLFSFAAGAILALIATAVVQFAYYTGKNTAYFESKRSHHQDRLERVEDDLASNGR